MDVSNVVRVLLEKAEACHGYAVQAGAKAGERRVEMERHQADAEKNMALRDEFRAAAEILSPGCVEARDAELLSSHPLSTLGGVTASTMSHLFPQN